jgi:hypothetical protein
VPPYGFPVEGQPRAQSAVPLLSAVDATVRLLASPALVAQLQRSHYARRHACRLVYRVLAAPRGTRRPGTPATERQAYGQREGGGRQGREAQAGAARGGGDPWGRAELPGPWLGSAPQGRDTRLAAPCGVLSGGGNPIHRTKIGMGTASGTPHPQRWRWLLPPRSAFWMADEQGLDRYDFFAWGLLL